MTPWIVTSSVLILAVVLVRGVLKGRIGLRLQYALWLPVLVRLLVPGFLFDSGISVLNGAQALSARQEAAVTDTRLPVQETHAVYPQTAVEEAIPALPAQPLPQNSSAAQKSVPVTTVLQWIYIGGMLAVGVWLAAVNLHFGNKLRQTRMPADTGLPIPVYRSALLRTPCLFGLFRPAVYLTGAETESQLPHVLAHEWTHFRHGDHIWAFLRCVCLAVHWFNPLVWLAAILSRRDAELACDEGAVSCLGEAHRAAYGKTLIGMTCQTRSAVLLTATTMGENKNSLRERITLLARHPRTAAVTLIAVLCISAVAVGCTFTGAKQPEPDRAELRLFGGDAVLDDLTAEEVALLNELYETKEITPTSAPVGDAARLEITFFEDGEETAVWTVTPEVCAATDTGNFIWENSRFDTVWALYTKELPVDGGTVSNLLMSSVPPRLTQQQALSVLARFWAMELTGTTNEPDWVNSLCVKLFSGETAVLCFEIDQKGEVVLFETAADRLNRENGHYYMCKDGEALYRELKAMHAGDSPLEQLALEYIQQEIAYYENDCEYTVPEHELVSLMQCTEIGQPVEAWLLEYRLRMADPASVILAGGMELSADGWLTGRGSMGQPVLLVYRTETQLISLGTTWTGIVEEEFGGDYDRCAQAALTDYRYRLEAGAPSYDAVQAILTLPSVEPSAGWWFDLRISYENGKTAAHWEPGSSVRLALDEAVEAWLTPIRTDEHGVEHPGTPIDLLPLRQIGTPLSQELLDELTQWLSQPDNYGFLLSSYEDVRDADLHQVFYSGAGLKDYGAEPYVQQAMEPSHTDITCLHEADMNELLLRRTGYGLEELSGSLEYWTYLEEHGLYAHEHGDTNRNSYVCTGGYRAVTGMELYVVNYQIVHLWFDHGDDGSVYMTETGTVVLQKLPHGYRFISNRLHPAAE